MQLRLHRWVICKVTVFRFSSILASFLLVHLGYAGGLYCSGNMICPVIWAFDFWSYRLPSGPFAGPAIVTPTAMPGDIYFMRLHSHPSPQLPEQLVSHELLQKAEHVPLQSPEHERRQLAWWANKSLVDVDRHKECSWVSKIRAITTKSSFDNMNFIWFLLLVFWGLQGIPSDTKMESLSWCSTA